MLSSCFRCLVSSVDVCLSFHTVIPLAHSFRPLPDSAHQAHEGRTDHLLFAPNPPFSKPRHLAVADNLGGPAAARVRL